MNRETDVRQLKTVDRACRIIEYLRENDEARLSEIAEAIDLTPGTVHTYLATLESNNLIDRNDGRYRLGLEFIPIGNKVRVQTDLLRVGKEHLEKLAYEHDSIAHLSTISGRGLIILHEAVAQNAIGKEFHIRKIEQIETTIHCTAAGKAILAHLPEPEVRAIIEEIGLPKYTSHTITDIGSLMEELEEVREQGFALNDEEVTKGHRAVGAPITRDDGSIEGAISISGPANYWKDRLFREELPRSVIRSANNIEMEIHSNPML
ncbi:IclR family transcriptional regulator domain-containing protein [Halobellus sp. GM3]|uniref:IclR family transcriptional regulator domain-containing protein n=1 Tax=Halobellus sp. GM3 TaxID=3458410 RepID=UPI00403DA296